MNAQALATDLEEFDWMLPGGSAWTDRAADTRRQRETRIAAMLFKRRWRLLIHWRKQSLKSPRPRAVKGRASRSAIEVTGLPERIAPLRGEIAIWRSLLAADLDAILFGTA